MTHRIIIQRATKGVTYPNDTLLKKWARLALNQSPESVEMTIRIVDTEEMTVLNETYRRKKGPTNVLSFPCDESPDGMLPLLGDVVICADVVNREAAEQSKAVNAHWAHMVIHGVLHLLGHDHEQEKDASVMEALEIELMQDLRFGNPYENETNRE